MTPAHLKKEIELLRSESRRIIAISGRSYREVAKLSGCNYASLCRFIKGKVKTGQVMTWVNMELLRRWVGR